MTHPKWDGTAPTGRSLLQHMTSELDAAYAKIHHKKTKHHHIAEGKARGLALAVAIMTNGYDPDFKRAWREAKRRHKRATKRRRQRAAA